MGWAPLALGAVSAVTSAVGTLSAGASQSSMASYNAAVARNNATIEQQNATYATRAGEAQSTTEGLKNAAVAGKIKTSQAASNIDVNSGSAADVQASQKETGELDTETVMNNALLKAYGYNTQATGYTAQAGLDTAEASSATTGSILGAGGTLLGSASSLGFKWNAAQNPGATGTGGIYQE